MVRGHPDCQMITACAALFVFLFIIHYYQITNKVKKYIKKKTQKLKSWDKNLLHYAASTIASKRGP